jgi:Ca2+-binding RTX toxin-like protein
MVLFPRSVRAWNRGIGTPQIEVDYPDYPLDYHTPTDSTVNPWGDQNSEGLVLAEADVTFASGQTTTYIPLEINKDGKSDGNDTLTWSISNSASYGFTQETYIFKENFDTNPDEFIGTLAQIPLSLNSTIKTATIIIENSDGTLITPINGTNASNSLLGGAGNDIIYAKAGKDSLDGKAGNDTLYGQEGDDNLKGNLGNDQVYGGSGHDFINGGSGHDYLDGLTGNDILNGNLGNDELRGFSGNDTLDGGDGNDFLDGEAGSDKFIGGAGNDFYVVDSTTETITELLNEGKDTVESSATFTLGANLEDLILVGGGGIDGTGNTLGNTIEGDEANNILFGSFGNDKLIGNDGDDTLIGGADNDTIEGGLGNDTLTGGSNADKFVFNFLFSDPIDAITDFKASDGDKIQVGFGSSPSQFTYNNSTGALSYDNDPFDGFGPIQFASLQPTIDFSSGRDIIFS